MVGRADALELTGNNCTRLLGSLDRQFDARFMPYLLVPRETTSIKM
jgi:hypothetical protein